MWLHFCKTPCLRLGCRTRIPQTGWFKQQKFTSHSSGKSRINVAADLVPPDKSSGAQGKEAYREGAREQALWYLL